MDERELRALIKREISRLKDGDPAPDGIADDEPLFSIPGECDSRLDLDSLDALELAFAIEEATGVSQPRDLDYRELLTVEAVVATLRNTDAASASTVVNPMNPRGG